MTEAALDGPVITRRRQPTLLWSTGADNAQPNAVSRDLRGGTCVELGTRPSRPAHPWKARWIVTFTIVAALLIAFVTIVAWGLARSDWLYGTYGEIRPTDWDEISRLRRELIQLGTAPGAVVALDDALLVPRPSTEDVIYDLRNAVLILRTGEITPHTSELLADLQALLQEIQASYDPSSGSSTPPSDPSLLRLPLE